MLHHVLISRFLLFFFHFKGDIVYLQLYPYHKGIILKIKFEKKGRHIKYRVPTYQVELVELPGYKDWYDECKLDIAPPN